MGWCRRSPVRTVFAGGKRRAWRSEGCLRSSGQQTVETRILKNICCCFMSIEVSWGPVTPNFLLSELYIYIIPGYKAKCKLYDQMYFLYSVYDLGHGNSHLLYWDPEHEKSVHFLWHCHECLYTERIDQGSLLYHLLRSNENNVRWEGRFSVLLAKWNYCWI